MLTSRGRSVLVIAFGIYVAGWALGTREAFVVAIGLGLAVTAAVAYVALTSGPFRLARRSIGSEHVEGEDVPVDLRVDTLAGLPPVGARLRDGLANVGQATVVLRRRRRGAPLGARYTMRSLPRGRYRLDEAQLEVEDPLGLARRVHTLAGQGALVVYPRIVETDRLFGTGGGPGGQAGQLLLQRGAGFDLHSVREHVRGESLRRVHWPSTARRGRLMVKELEDQPRDEAAVVLDGRVGLDVGQAPDSSFEMAVRAAGSIIRRLVLDGRRTGLIVSGARSERTAVQSEGDWRLALDVLAGVRPDGTKPIAGAFEDGAVEGQLLYVVTSDLSPRLADRLSALAGRRQVAVAWVDARSWGDGSEPGAPDGIASTLARRGVAVTRIRKGDDLAARLGGLLVGRESA